ncbi:AfsR/SARP family transcriptional regulator [Kutzneria sp. NPDC052558]|uniref:AfsR/SARP family transcriptional regulator n=1 Tax=Kutzneria sp. NPDC052558 TaxID=3364121 RepID=UPI0037CC00A1
MKVCHTGEPVATGGRRQRAVLAALLFHANSVASVDYLAASVWERPQAASKSNIRTYVSQLRRTFRDCGEPDSRLVTGSGGYLLTVRPSELDLQVFRDLAGQGELALQHRDFAAAATHLGHALDLWSGQPLAGEPLAPGLRAKVVGVMELRLTAVEQHARARIELGQPQSVIGDLRALLAENPLREELWAQLMLALYRCDRQAEALDAFTRARQHLVEELGIEPGPRLRLLQREILSGGAGADRMPTGPVGSDAAGAWRQLPMDITEFTGRHTELSTLRALIADDDRGVPSTVVISAIEGMAGVGKTRLAVHFAHEMISAGRCDEIQLWTDLRGFDPEHPPADPASVLENFLRLLGVPGHQIPPGLESRAALYRDRLIGKRALILLDNAAREEQVRPLLPGAAGSVVLITSRRRLTALDGAHVLPLDVLPGGQAIALLARISDDGRIAAEPEAAATVVELCGRLPIAVSLAARRLRSRPLWTVRQLADRLARDEHTLDSLSPHTHGLQTIFDLSYRAVPAQQRRLFRLLGLHIGADFTAESAAALSGTRPEHAERLLEALLDEHLLRQVVAGRYCFHDLIRPYARDRVQAEETTVEREQAVQRLLAWYLHTAESARGVLDPHRVRIIDLHPLPADCVVSAFRDHDDGLAWFEAERVNLVAAVRAAARWGLPAVAWQLPWVLLSFFYRRSHWHDWIATYRIALEATRSLGKLREEGVIWRGLGVAHSDIREFDIAIDCHRRAQTILEETGDRHGQAWNLNNLGVAFVDLDRLPAAADCFGRALPMFRETGDRQGVGICLNNLGDTHRRLGAPAVAIGHLQEALAVQRDIDDQAGMQFTLTSLGDVHRDVGQYEIALRHYRDALSTSERIADRRAVARTLANLAQTYDLTGDADRAVEHRRRALAIFTELGDTQADDIRVLLRGRD